MSVLSHRPIALPGAFTITPGAPEDYFELERFHYQPLRPRTWCAVWTVRWSDDSRRTRTIGVGVLSWPVPCILEREGYFGLTGRSYRERIGFVNEHLRTISRVVIHPQFRSLGLASTLVRKLCQTCPTRYVEALAVMGRVHPFFERAGMKRVMEMEKGEWRMANVEEKTSTPSGAPCSADPKDRVTGSRVGDDDGHGTLRPWYYLYDREGG